MEKKEKFEGLCRDCMFNGDNETLCDLCFEGANYEANVCVWTEITARTYKELFRNTTSMHVFECFRVWDTIKNVKRMRRTYDQMAQTLSLFVTSVKTRSLMHYKAEGNVFFEEEMLKAGDSYYCLQYRDVAYLMHKKKEEGMIAVRAIRSNNMLKPVGVTN